MHKSILWLLVLAFIFLASCFPFFCLFSTHAFTHVYVAVLLLCQQAHTHMHHIINLVPVSQTDSRTHTHAHTLDSRSEDINNMQQQLCAIKTESKTSGRKNVRTTHEQSRGSLARALISHKQPTKMPAMRGKRGMKSEGKIQWLDKWVRERERERQRGRESWCRSRNTKEPGRLFHLWVTEQVCDREKRREGGRDERRDMRDDLTYAFWKISPSCMRFTHS